jgi:hypothetical protein
MTLLCNKNKIKYNDLIDKQFVTAKFLLQEIKEVGSRQGS